jgi:hypothetical protein
MHAAPDDDAPSAARASARRPRNYLAASERRRVFWRFMPPALLAVVALGWVEQTWFPRPGGPPPAKQVDTRLDAVRGARPEGDAVLIEPEPDPFMADATGLAASAEQLARVRDDAFFRREDEPAWIQTWLTLRSADPVAVRRAAQPVSFTELFGQPASFRGRAVQFKGTLRRLERVRAPANDFDVTDYWQGWLEPAAGPASPIVVHFLRIPAGMPEGLKISEPVEVAGYFFKRYAYKATDTIRRAPLVLAIEPDWKPRPPAQAADTSLATILLVSMVSLVVAGVVATLFGSTRNRPPPEPPSDLDAALAGADIVSTQESLRRLAAEHADREYRTPETDR